MPAFHLVTRTGTIPVTIPATDLFIYLELTAAAQWSAEEMLGAVQVFVSMVTGDILMPTRF